MNDSKENLEKQLIGLQHQVKALKKMLARLTETTTDSRDKALTWVYAMEGNRDGLWDWNATTNEVYFSTRWKEILGFEEDEITNKLSEWDNRLHPDDREAVYADLNAHLDGRTPYYESEHRLRCKDGSYKWIHDRGKVFSWTEDGSPARVVGTHTDITVRKEAEIKNRRLLNELRAALEKVRLLSGLIPICSVCKKIRDDRGYWNQLEHYLKTHSEAEFTHSICPDCAKKIYPEMEFDDDEDP